MEHLEFTTLRLDVLRPADGLDFTSNGISALHETLTLVGHSSDRQEVHPLTEGVSSSLERIEAPVLLMLRKFGYGPTLHLIPAQWDNHTEQFAPLPGWSMAGGNYATTTDSRFSRLLEELLEQNMYGAIAIHDRYEN